MNPAVFIDRDGTIIEDVGYPKDPALVKLIPGAVEAVRAFLDNGFQFVVISNQSGIGRGIITLEEAGDVHNRFVEILFENGIKPDGVYYCPHTPEDRCECRKPKPGLLLKAQRELQVDLDSSFMIGDRLSDVATGKNAGTKGILFRDHPDNKNRIVEPDFSSSDWDEIVQFILTKGKSE